MKMEITRIHQKRIIRAVYPNGSDKRGYHIVLTLQDAKRLAEYPPIQYIPREDIDPSQLKRTDHTTYCPYKGDCNYYSIPAGGEKSVNAVWTYERPYPAVAQIKGHVAFYPDRVNEIAEKLS